MGLHRKPLRIHRVLLFLAIIASTSVAAHDIKCSQEFVQEGFGVGTTVPGWGSLALAIARTPMHLATLGRGARRVAGLDALNQMSLESEPM
jgi:hypothetical protein